MFFIFYMLYIISYIYYIILYTMYLISHIKVFLSYVQHWSLFIRKTFSFRLTNRYNYVWFQTLQLCIYPSTLFFARDIASSSLSNTCMKEEAQTNQRRNPTIKGRMGFQERVLGKIKNNSTGTLKCIYKFI